MYKVKDSQRLNYSHKFVVRSKPHRLSPTATRPSNLSINQIVIKPADTITHKNRVKLLQGLDSHKEAFLKGGGKVTAFDSYKKYSHEHRDITIPGESNGNS